MVSQVSSLPSPWHEVNEALAFLLELIMLGVLAWWGAQAVSGLAGRILLAVAVPLLAAVIWGLFAAPRARVQLPLAGILTVKAIEFGGAAAALAALGHPVLAVVFAAVALVNTTLAARDRLARV
jgi:hypothetical protein